MYTAAGQGGSNEVRALFIFEDEAAQEAHGSSDAVRHFESVYGPELVGGPVVFTDYVQVATNRAD
jgi:hypothetical protein